MAAKKKKSKKEKNIYDENGHWVEERNRIKGSIRRTFRLSPQMKEASKAARVELPPALKKDGTPGKRPQVRFRCNHCKELFSSKQINVDHLIPAVELHIKEKNMSYDELVRGIFCSVSNLQVLCSIPMKKNNGLPSCHQKKTNEEKYLRGRLDASKITPEDEKYKDAIELYKSDFIVYQLEQIEKIEAKNKRKSEREAKSAKRLKELEK